MKEEPLKCDKCSYTATRPKFLAVHMSNHNAQGPIYMCPQCDYTTVAGEATLRIHMRSHRTSDSEKKFKCEECSFRTHYRVSIDNHIVTRHKANVSYSKVHRCDQCDYSTTVKTALGTHVLHAHANADSKVFRCPNCPYETHVERTLQGHKQRVHRQREAKEFQCPDCKYSTGHKNFLQRHVGRVHAPGRVPKGKGL